MHTEYSLQLFVIALVVTSLACRIEKPSGFQTLQTGPTETLRLYDHTRITKPEPRRVLVETDVQSGTPTTFRILPLEDGSRIQVIVSTEQKNRGCIQGFLGKWMLERVYRAELGLLVKLAEEQKISNPT
jgi:hypothetical protein